MGEHLESFRASGGDILRQKKQGPLLVLARNIPGETPLGGGGSAPISSEATPC